MGQRITIQIRNKIANCLTELPVVCGNSNYKVEFDFDAEWDGHSLKTAVFTSNGKSYQKVFDGNVCDMPAFENTLIVWVGVFAGTIDDGTLSTSTPALVHCIPCITDGDAIPSPPPDDVYNQIIKMLAGTSAKVEETETGAKITITDVHGTTEVEVKNGENYVLTDSDKDEIANMVGKADLLWENASPTSTFARQSYSLGIDADNNPYQFLLVTCMRGRGSQLVSPALIVPRFGRIYRAGTMVGASWDWRAIRNVEFYTAFKSNGTEIVCVTFGSCEYYNSVNDSHASESIYYCIPFQVYGIRGV